MKNLLRAGAALALVLITMFATLAFRPSAQAYEYYTVHLSSDKNKSVATFSDGRRPTEFDLTKFLVETKKIMDTLGNEGWELVTTETGYLIFKRPK